MNNKPAFLVVDLRDYFAAKALPALIISWEKSVKTGELEACGVELFDLVAEHCYEYADAMIKAREAK